MGSNPIAPANLERKIMKNKKDRKFTVGLTSQEQWYEQTTGVQGETRKSELYVVARDYKLSGDIHR